MFISAIQPVWISHKYAYISSPLNLSPPSSHPSSPHRALGWAPCVIQKLPTSYLFYTCTWCSVTQLCSTFCNPMDYIAHQAPLFIGYSRKEYQSELLPGATTGDPTHDKGHAERTWQAKADQASRDSLDLLEHVPPNQNLSVLLFCAFHQLFWH